MDGDRIGSRRLRPLDKRISQPKQAGRAKRGVAGDGGRSAEHERRLEELKQRIAEGRYEPDPERIAREIMRRGLEPD
jgi:hypothetical protein